MKLDLGAEQFFAAVGAITGGNSEVTFNYLAVHHDNQLLLISSRMWFVHKARVPFSHFSSGRVMAGQYRLNELGCSPRELVGQIAQGSVVTPNGTLHFPVDKLGGTHEVFHSHHEAGLATQSRISVLSITTGCPHIDLVALDWEVKAAPTPFDSLQELVSHYAAGEVLRDRSTFEAIALGVAAVDRGSIVQGTEAHLKIRLVEGLSIDGATMGYRVLSNREVVQRGSLSSSEFLWENIDGAQVGSKTITVPPAAAIQCIACFNQVAQQTYWIADPSNFQNPFRAAYEAFDPGLLILKDFLQLTQGTGKGKPQADFETGVSWLLWMLGFGSAQLGLTGKTTEAPDLMVTTPSGQIAIVECTLGLLKAENKLAKVFHRAAAVREQIAASNNGHLQVIAIIVSSMAREHLIADIEQAETLGVLVLSKENLLDGINRTMLIPNSEVYYKEAIDSIRAAQDKHRMEEV